MHLAPAPGSARAARRFVDATLGSWECGRAVEVVVLLANELVTNAVLHADTDVDLRLRRATDRVRVEVGDRSGGRPEARELLPGAQTGRGLALVDALADRWGVDPGGTEGKVVWFEVPLDG